jgi:predicted membrane chloride channel (bestrophin family)
MKGSVLLTVWPQMAVTAGIAVFATMLRASMGQEEYLIQDVKGHATLGTALAFLNVFRSNLSYGRYATDSHVCFVVAGAWLCRGCG